MGSNSSRPRIFICKAHVLDIEKVSVFIDKETSTWDRAKMEGYLFDEDIQEVMKILIRITAHEDLVAWRYSKKGNFNVKT